MFDRIELARRQGRKAALNNEDIKQYTDLMKSPQERSVFTEAYYFALQEINQKKKRNEVEESKSE